MIPQTATALDEVEEPLRSDLVALLEEAAAWSQADEALLSPLERVVLLTSRRLGCAYLMLVKEGHDPFDGDGRVVLDRVVDLYPAQFWRGKHVLILDDSVVLGTTIRDLHGRLTALGAVVSVRTCVVDQDQVARFLTSDIDFAAKSEQHSDVVSKFSVDLVKAMYRMQVPFFSDFPSVKPVRVTVKQWENFLRTSGWNAADVTPAFFDGSGCQSVSLLPNDETFRRILSRLPQQAADLVALLKLRTFARPSDDGISIDVVVVPLVLLWPVSSDELLTACSALVELQPDSTTSGSEFKAFEPVALHRLVQILLTSAVLAEVWPNLAHGDLSVDVIEQRQLELHFGTFTRSVLDCYSTLIDSYQQASVGDGYQQPPRFAGAPLSKLFERGKVNDALWSAREQIAAVDTPGLPSEGVRLKVGHVFAHAVASFFGFLNEEYEKDERRRIRGLSDLDRFKQDYGKGQRFLRQHATFADLMRALLPDSPPDVWSRGLLSLAIDVGNDMGIIVPETKFDEASQIVFRCYRLGEGAPLASKPLAEAVHTGDYDTMTQEAIKHGDLVSRDVVIGSVDDESTKMSESEMAAQIAATTPGELLLRYEGTIAKADHDSFVADLVTAEGVVDQGRMLLDALSNSDRERVAVGARFYYASYRSSGTGSGSTITTKVRFRQEPPVDLEAMRRAGEAYAQLFE